MNGSLSLYTAVPESTYAVFVCPSLTIHFGNHEISAYQSIFHLGLIHGRREKIGNVGHSLNV